MERNTMIPVALITLAKMVVAVKVTTGLAAYISREYIAPRRGFVDAQGESRVNAYDVALNEEEFNAIRTSSVWPIFDTGITRARHIGKAYDKLKMTPEN